MECAYLFPLNFQCFVLPHPRGMGREIKQVNVDLSSYASGSHSSGFSSYPAACSLDSVLVMFQNTGGIHRAVGKGMYSVAQTANEHRNQLHTSELIVPGPC